MIACQRVDVFDMHAATARQVGADEIGQIVMNPRLKKLIGTVVMVVFVAFYAMLIVAIAPRILTGASKVVELVFYVVAGLAWAFPLMPLIRWMERR